MKALVLLALLLAQVNPQMSEQLLREKMTVVESQALREAVPPVEQWLGRKLLIYEASNLPSLPMAEMFPSAPEQGEAIITPTAVFLAKSRFTQFRSSFELAEFLSHVAAHVKLNHQQKWVERRQGRADLERVRKEYEEEAEKLAEEILPTADCAPGPCARFGRLMQAVRK